jgi:LIM domain
VSPDEKLCPAGNLDRQNGFDLVVGSVGDRSFELPAYGHGVIWILFLSDDGVVLSHQRITTDQGNFGGVLYDNYRFGGSVAVLGDLSSPPDGVVEIAVGQDNPWSSTTDIWVISLTTAGTVLGERKIVGADLFGVSLGTIGQIGGRTVIAAGAPYSADGGRSRGALWLIGLNRVDFSSATTGTTAGTPVTTATTGTSGVRFSTGEIPPATTDTTGTTARSTTSIAPITTAPATTAPVTTAPVTTAPVTTAPGTTAFTTALSTGSRTSTGIVAVTSSSEVTADDGTPVDGMGAGGVVAVVLGVLLCVLCVVIVAAVVLAKDTHSSVSSSAFDEENGSNLTSGSGSSSATSSEEETLSSASSSFAASDEGVTSSSSSPESSGDSSSGHASVSDSSSESDDESGSTAPEGSTFAASGEDDNHDQPQQTPLQSPPVVATAPIAALMSCERCSKSVAGKRVEILGRTWHPDCFRCANCDAVLRREKGGAKMRHDEFWCSKCVAERSVSHRSLPKAD